MKLHPFFADIDWALLSSKRVTPPFKPTVQRVTDTNNFDVEFTSMPLHSHEANKQHSAQQQPQQTQQEASHTDSAHQAAGSGSGLGVGHGLAAVSGVGAGVDVDAGGGEEEDDDDDDGADGEAGDAGQFQNFTFIPVNEFL